MLFYCSYNPRTRSEGKYHALISMVGSNVDTYLERSTNGYIPTHSDVNVRKMYGKISLIQFLPGVEGRGRNYKNKNENEKTRGSHRSHGFAVKCAVKD